jgi:hypothetical protein
VKVRQEGAITFVARQYEAHFVLPPPTDTAWGVAYGMDCTDWPQWTGLFLLSWKILPIDAWLPSHVILHRQTSHGICVRSAFGVSPRRFLLLTNLFVIDASTTVIIAPMSASRDLSPNDS